MGVNLGGSLMSGITNAKLAELYELVKNGGMSLADAMRKLGIDKKVSEKTAQHLLKTRYGLQAAGSGGVIGTLGAFGTSIGLTGGKAVAAGVGAEAVIFDGLAVGGYILAGQLGGFAGDSYVKSGDLGNANYRKKTGTITKRPEAVAAGSGEGKYYVYVLDISGGSVWVGQESTLKNTPSCKFAGGGLCEGAGNNPPKIIKQSKAYDTESEADAAWCEELQGKKKEDWVVAGDKKAEVYGGKYWLGLAPGCN